jgi:hypothetical protein
MAEEKVGLSYPIEFLVTGLIAYDQVQWTRKLRREKPEEYERYTRNRNQLRYAIEILAREARADMVVESGNGISEDGEADNVLQKRD